VEAGGGRWRPREDRTISEQERISVEIRAGQSGGAGRSAEQSDGQSHDASVQVQVNGQSRRVPAPHRVSQLLEMLGMGGRRVAVAVNREVLLRSQLCEFELAEGDRVEILEAVGGG